MPGTDGDSGADRRVWGRGDTLQGSCNYCSTRSLGAGHVTAGRVEPEIKHQLARPRPPPHPRTRREGPSGENTGPLRPLLQTQ